MSNETIADLRKHLFAALDGLADKDRPMDIERAKAISAVAQTVINSARVEIEHMKLAGGAGSGFIPDAQVVRLPGLAKVETTETATAMVSVTHLPGATITRHKMRD
jgi:hypothetical protein